MRVVIKDVLENIFFLADFSKLSTYICKYIQKWQTIYCTNIYRNTYNKALSIDYTHDARESEVGAPGQLQQINTNTAIVPCSARSYHFSVLEKKFQWTPDTETVFLLQRDLCLQPPQVTRSILANLDISMEPFHQIFF